MDARHAKELGERLCHQVRHIALDVRGGNLSSFSISVGISVYPKDGRGCEDLLRVADEALYQAKAQGKDRVILAGWKPEDNVEHIVVN
jgi:diguanylate cyclase (GGDEF)-like protein